MKKIIASALTAAVVIGAASTTFAKDFTDEFSLDAEARYTYAHIKFAKGVKAHPSVLELRLLPTYRINDDMSIKARFTGAWDIDADDTDGDMNYLYLDADFDAYNFNVGKIPLVSWVDNNPMSGGFFDDFFTGVQATTEYDDNFTLKVDAGRWNEIKDTFGGNHVTYISGEGIYTDDDERFTAGVGYHYVKNRVIGKNNVLMLGGSYNVNEDWNVYGAYAKNTDANALDKAYNVEAVYRGADTEEPGSYGAFVAYRYVGVTASPLGTVDTYRIFRNIKGFDFGGNYVPIENTLVRVSYLHGKNLINNDTSNVFVARASWFF